MLNWHMPNIIDAPGLSDCMLDETARMRFGIGLAAEKCHLRIPHRWFWLNYKQNRYIKALVARQCWSATTKQKTLKSVWSVRDFSSLPYNPSEFLQSKSKVYHWPMVHPHTRFMNLYRIFGNPDVCCSHCCWYCMLLLFLFVVDFLITNQKLAREWYWDIIPNSKFV